MLAQLQKRIENKLLYVRRFGWKHGPQVARKLFPPGDSREVVDIQLPGYAQPLRLRQGTSDVATFWKIFVEEEYGFDLPFEPRYIIDGGANCGYSACYFHHRYPQARIVALEPADSNFAVLTHNTAPYPEIACVQAGVWSSSGWLRIVNPEANASGFQVELVGERQADSFPALSIADIVAQYPSEQIDLLKLDVEGAEREIFSRGYMDWLPKVRALVIELHDRIWPACKTVFEAAMEGQPFDRQEVGENLVLIRRD
ncbi:MAG: hypothetical protein OHK0039_21020 [Bacteroidia bacterium]